MKPNKNRVTLAALVLFFAGGCIPEWRAGLGLCASAAALVGFRDPAALKAGSWKFWLFPALFFGLMPFLSLETDTELLGLPYSSVRLLEGLNMLFHAYVFTVISVFVARSYSGEEIVAAAVRVGLKNTGIKVTLALIILKNLKAMLTETYYYYVLWRPGTVARVKDAPAFFFAVLRNAAKAAEDLSVLFYLRDVRV